MHARVENPASRIPQPDMSRMSRSAALARVSGRTPAAAKPAQAGGARRAQRAAGLRAVVGSGWLRQRAGARHFVVALLGALVIGVLVHGTWLLVTWTPLPPQQFAADLGEGSRWQRDAACSELALRKARGPYDASMLAYRFDPRTGLCTALDEDGFRDSVMQARERHQRVATVLALLAALGALGWRLEGARAGTAGNRPLH